MLQQYLVEIEYRLQQGRVADLRRQAQVDRLVRRARGSVRRDVLDVTRAAAWVAAEAHAAVTALQQRFISPCGQIVLRQAKADC